MYSLGNALTLLRNPRGIPGVIHQLGTAANQRYYRYRDQPSDFSIMDEDWDNLFLLDGCRYDLFEDTADLEGELESRTSPGSSSSDFLESTFTGRRYLDTVYVTANPHFDKIPDGTFHANINLLDDGWDPDLQTVPPDVMANAVREAHHEYPDKRILAHFMQPHYPFIGEHGREIQQGGIGRRNYDGEKLDSGDEGDIWVKLQFRLNGVKADDVWKGYQENLALVLDEIEQLLPDIDGKTVLSTDHGNLVGDWIGPIPCRGYGHPPNLYVDELVEIPWFIIPGDRRVTTAESPDRKDTINDEVVANRLVNLGYKE